MNNENDADDENDADAHVNTAEARRRLVQRRLAARRVNGDTNGSASNGHRPIPAADRDQLLPLSFGQERLWFENQRAPDSAEYQVPVVLRVDSPSDAPLDVAALDAAYRTVVARHEILRTRYRMRHARPFQVIDPPGPDHFAVHLDVTDLAGAPEQALDVARREIARPFHLGLEHPARLRLLRLGDTEHILVLTLHHICCDGTSLGLLVTELFETYGRLAAGEDVEPHPPAVQYADYAVWQRDQLAGGVLDEHVRYWCDRLADQPSLELPVDHPRASVRDPHGDRCQFTVPATLAADLRELAREHHTTLYTVTLTAFQVLLARYSGQRDIAVGSALTARQRPELRDAVGFYIDTAVLRARWDGDATFTDLLRHNRTTVLAAIEHKGAPLQRVTEELGIARDPSRPSLFQVMFDLVDAAPERFELGGLSLRRLDVVGTIAKHDLRLELAHTPDGPLAAVIEYPTALFEPATITRLGEHYLRLLTAITADPHTPVADLPLLNSDDRRRMLTCGTGERVDLTELSEASDLLAAQARRNPSGIAVVAEGERLTFAELDADANRFARQFAAHGAGRESIVAVCLDRGIDLLPALFGVWRCGATSLPLDPSDPPERLAHILRDAGCAVLVTEWPHLQRLPGDVAADVVLVDVAMAAIAAQDPTPLHNDVHPDVHLDDLAYVVYTSGSTGRPKGVEVTHRALRCYLESVARPYFAGKTGAGAALLTSVTVDMAVTSLYAPLLVGEPVHLLPCDLGPTELLRELAHQGGFRVVKLTPSHLELLTRIATPEQATALASTLVVGGEGFAGDLARRWFDLAGDAATVVNEYGPTENTVASVTYRVTRESRPGASGLLPIGTPTANTTAYVLDESLRPVPFGVVGELFLGGAQVARGYHGMPAETARRFLADPYGAPGGRLYRTGDRAALRPDGTIEFHRRADDQLAVRGYRVEPGEIVAALREHPAITEAAVVPRDTGAGTVLVGYIVSDGSDGSDGAPSHRELRAFLADRLPGHMIPTAFVPLDALPTTTAGKLDHRALPKPDRAALGLPPEPARPPTELERRIADVWRDLLEVGEVGVDDGYFDLGGDSVNAVAVVGTLRDAGLDVTVQDLFEHPTVTDLADTLASRPALAADTTRVAPFELLTDAERRRLPDDVVDAYPLSMLQAGMLYEMLSSDSDVHYYHNATSYTIRDDAPFDADAFQRAVDALVARHEMLRTGFDLYGRRPLQLVHPTATLTADTADIRELAASEQDAAVRDYMHRQRAALFRVATPPLFALCTHVVGETTWHLTITECHPILEGWGYHLLLMELLERYRALRDGQRPPEQAPLPVRYADFIAAEQASLASDDDRGFWREIVTTTPKFTLPARWASDTPQPRKPVVLEVPFVDLLDELRDLGRLAGAPLKSVLHAAHLAVLSTLTDLPDFYTGLVCDTRPEIAGAERLPGLFLNTVPFRYQRGATTWRELVRAVFDTEIALWPHRRYPMYAMQREHRPGGRLIDVLFNYLDFHSVDTDLVDFNAAIDDSPNEFRLAATAFAQGMISLRFHLDTVSMRDGERLVAMYRAVLATMAAEPDGAASRSTVLGALPVSPPDDIARPTRHDAESAAPDRSGADRRDHPAADVAEVERLLTEAWAAALDLERIDVHDDLTELGADSLRGLRVAAVMAQHGYEVSPMAAISYPTVAALAPHVRRR